MQTHNDQNFRKLSLRIQKEMKRLQVPGIAIGVYHQGREWTAGFGVTSVEHPLPVTPDTLMQVGSISKTFTGTVLMKLAEQGQVDLDAPVRKYLKDFKLKDKHVTQRVTIRHLLTHTGGWGYDLWSQDLIRYQKLKDIPGIGSCKNIALTTPLLSDPGERWNYGIGIDWAGKTVEAISGKKLGEVKDIVLEKTSNNILFAVVSFGGVLGMGEKYHPVPWAELDYDPERGGYTVSFTAEQLKNAPSDSIDALTKGDGRTFRDRAFTHYGTKPYWH